MSFSGIRKVMQRIKSIESKFNPSKASVTGGNFSSMFEKSLQANPQKFIPIQNSMMPNSPLNMLGNYSFNSLSMLNRGRQLGHSMMRDGSEAVALGRRFLGRVSKSLKGQLPRFTAAGGYTNNCADFVSSLLENTGRLKGHHINVIEMEKALIRQGYRKIPASQAKPGDVWISYGRGHTELVAEYGGGKTIGSNNIRPGFQVITERTKTPDSGVYYQLTT